MFEVIMGFSQGAVAAALCPNLCLENIVLDILSVRMHSVGGDRGP